MNNTSFQSFDVPGAATAQTRPLSIAEGVSVAVRVLVRNVGAVPLFVSGASADVVSPEGPSSTTYQLDPSLSDVFVLSPKQKLFCIGATPGGRVCVSVSEALPLL